MWSWSGYGRRRISRKIVFISPMVWIPMPACDRAVVRVHIVQGEINKRLSRLGLVGLGELVEDHPDELLEQCLVVRMSGRDEKLNELVFIKSKDDAPDFDRIAVRGFSGGTNPGGAMTHRPFAASRREVGGWGCDLASALNSVTIEYCIESIYAIGDLASRISVVGGHGRVRGRADPTPFHRPR